MQKMVFTLALIASLIGMPAHAFKVGGMNWISSDGTANQCLKTDGLGNLGWEPVVRPTDLSATAPLSYNSATGLFSMPVCTASQDGYLSHSDWSLFNAKQNALTFGNLTSPTTGVSITGGSGAVIGSGAALSIQNATTAQPGLLTAADWNTFNGKQNALTFGNFTTPGVIFGVTGGTGAVIGSGLSLSLNNQSVNTLFAGPSSGASATPSFRSLVLADIPPTVLSSTANGGVTGTLPIGNGGSGATTQQTAINALTGTQSAGKYLRSDGTNATLSTIQVGDVPTLNQNTTGTASNVTGTVAVGNGGTGQTSFASGVIHSNGTALSSSAIVDADVSATAAIAPSKLGQASAITNQALVWNGTAWAPGSVGGGALSVTGSPASPQNITAAGGIAFTGAQSRTLWFVQGSGGPVTVTANPQIAAATTVGQELVVVGGSDANNLTLNDGAGLSLNGPMTFYKNTMLYLISDGSNWVENDRRN